VRECCVVASVLLAQRDEGADDALEQHIKVYGCSRELERMRSAHHSVHSLAPETMLSASAAREFLAEFEKLKHAQNEDAEMRARYAMIQRLRTGVCVDGVQFMWGKFVATYTPYHVADVLTARDVDVARLLEPDSLLYTMLVVCVENTMQNPEGMRYSELGRLNSRLISMGIRD
jgi:hypothetical protein